MPRVWGQAPATSLALTLGLGSLGLVAPKLPLSPALAHVWGWGAGLRRSRPFSTLLPDPAKGQGSEVAQAGPACGPPETRGLISELPEGQ